MKQLNFTQCFIASENLRAQILNFSEPRNSGFIDAFEEYYPELRRVDLILDFQITSYDYSKLSYFTNKSTELQHIEIRNGDLDWWIATGSPHPLAWGKPPLKEIPVMLELLKEKRIFDLKPSEDGKLMRIREACDKYYEVNLNKNNLKQLAWEILKLAEGMKD